jgi:hypothetical protein
MCGIVGVLQYESEVSREIRQRALRLLFTNIMLQTEARGRDATGLYQVHRDGDWAAAKKGVEVSKWLFESSEGSADPVVYNDFMDSWLLHPQELTALVGHCRKATVGSRGRDNRDNHPFSIQVGERHAILGVHNGTLLNHEIIFGKLPQTLERQGKVDSEAIFHLMFHLSERGTKPFTVDMVKEVGRKLDGAFACIVVNSRFPNIVATFRESRPLEFCAITPLSIVIASSDQKYVDQALKDYEFIRKMVDPELPVLKSHTRQLLDKDYRIFDTSLPFAISGAVAYADFDKISEAGMLRTHRETIDPDWAHETTTPDKTVAHKKTPATTPAIGAGSTSAASPGGVGTVVDAKISKPTTSSLALLPAEAGVKTVEVEVGSPEEAQQAFVRAKSLGLCPNYYSISEIAEGVGVSLADWSALGPAAQANLIGQTGFNRGYGAARFDSRKETEVVLSRARGLTKRLEKVEEKKKRSQVHVWERNQVVVIITALAREGYSINLRNIKLSLATMTDLTRERKEAIFEAARGVLADKAMRSRIFALRKKQKAAEIALSSGAEPGKAVAAS